MTTQAAAPHRQLQETARPANGLGKLSHLKRFALAFGIAWLISHSAPAAQQTWTGATSTTWSVNGNWSTAAPTNDLVTDTALFDLTSYTGKQPTVSTATSVAGITIGDGTTTTGSLSLTETGALSIGATGITMNAHAGAATLTGSTLLGANQTWTNNSANLLATGAISNIGNTTPFTLTIAGSGNQTLSGIISDGGSTGTTGIIVNTTGSASTTISAANTFTGGLAIQSGTVIGGANANTFGAGSISLGNGSSANATLQTTSSKTYANLISTVAGSTGTLTILHSAAAGNPTFSGGIALGSGTTLTLEFGGSGSYGVSTGNITSTSGTGNLVIKEDSTGAITVSSPSINNNGTITNSGTGTAATVLSGALGASVQGIVENSATSGLTLSGADSSFTGTTTITAGTITTAVNNAFGTGSSNIVIGGTSGINSAGLLINAVVTLTRNFTVQAGSAGEVVIGSSSTSGNTTATYSGGITLNRNAALETTSNSNATGNFSGNITGVGALTLISNGGKSGAVGSTLSGTGNTYAGGTTVDGGLWSVGSSSSLGSGNVTVNGGTLNLGAAATVNTGGGANITDNAGGTVVLGFTPATSAAFASLFNSTSSGVVVLSGAYSNSLNLLTLGNGSMYLGGNATAGANVSTTTLGSGTGNIYRLGGASNFINNWLTISGLDALTDHSFANTTNAQVEIGSPLAPASYSGTQAGWVQITNAQNYSGGTIVNQGSLLEGTAQTTGGNSPFGSGTAAVTLNGGEIELANNSTATTTTNVGALTFNGGSTLASLGGASGSNALVVASLTRGAGSALIISQAANSIITVTTGAPVPSAAGMISPYFTDASGNFLTYASGTGFADATTTSTITIGSVTAANVKLAAGASITADSTVNSLNTAGQSIAISAGKTLTVTSGGVSMGVGGINLTIGTNAVASTLAFDSSEGILNQSLNGSNQGSTTINATITGSGGLTKTGTGTIALATDNSAGLTGTVTIDAGTLQISADNFLGNASNGLMIDGGTLGLANANSTVTLAATRTITVGTNGGTILNGSNGINVDVIAGKVTGTGAFLAFSSSNANSGTNDTFTLTNTANDFTASIYIDNPESADTLSFGSDNELGNAANSIQISNLATLQETSNGVTSNRTINFTNLGGNIDVTAANVYTVGTTAGGISGDGNLTKTDTGTLVLSGTNTLTGNTIVSGGNLTLTGTLLTSPIIGIGAGATFQIGNSTSSGSIGSTATVNDAGTLAFDRTGSAFTFANAVSGTGAVSQIGSGTTVLTNANTYTGGTVINAGTLQVGNNTAAGTLGSGGVTGAGGTLAYNRTDSITESNAISGGVAVSQNGTGSTALSSNNSYSGGTSVTAGTLYANNAASSTGTGNVAVANNATLSGAGTIAPTGSNKVTIASGGNIAPGGVQPVAGPGIAPNGSLSINTTGINPDSVILSASAGSGLTFALGAGGAGPTNSATSVSQLLVTGNVANIMNFNVGGNSGTSTVVTIDDLVGTALTLAGANDTTEYVLIQGNPGTTYGGLTLGSSTVLGQQILGGLSLLTPTPGNSFSNQFSGAALFLDGDNIVLAVPEPGTWALMLGGLGLLVFFQRRKRIQSQR